MVIVTRGIETLVDEAQKAIREIAVQDALALSKDADWLIVDVREARERERDGIIPGSFHCPRGMVEFWIDPNSPYFKTIFNSKPNLLFHCALDWRSTLTVYTLQQMGITNAAHLKGGLKAWKEAGGTITFPFHKE
ncbi:rhodanese-like domain-containing protein [Ferrovibrio xuzhouensis]|uniref:Rhodanese-like domain-containing protein n=1 Tax=Ferrovibrio xuzhouensis TaxID=1576914 RepID=A0ABV7VLM6_9PROT